MSAKRYSLIVGIVMLAMGLVALIPALEGSEIGLPRLALESSYGLFLGMIPLNILSKIALIAWGAAGIWVYYNAASGVQFSRWLFTYTVVLALLGLIPATNTLFGYMPLFRGAVVWHALVALASAYFAFSTARVTARDSFPRAA